MSESIVIANSTIRQQDGLYCLNDMTRDMKLYELRMLVLGYMQNEDPKKAAEVFEKWVQEVKEVSNGNHQN